MPRKDPEEQRKYWREWYAKNQRKYLEKHYANRAAHKKTVRKQVDSYKATLTCNRCGFNNPAALQFHHPKGVKKDLAIGEAVTKNWGFTRIMKEINKCEVLCANCHSIEHNSRDVAQRERTSLGD